MVRKGDDEEEEEEDDEEIGGGTLLVSVCLCILRSCVNGLCDCCFDFENVADSYFSWRIGRAGYRSLNLCITVSLFSSLR